MKKSRNASATSHTMQVVNDLIRQWEEVAASPSELAAFRKALTSMAKDFRLSPTELRALAAKGNAADQLRCLLEALRISPSALAKIKPRLMRDLKRVCSMCDHKCECDCDIAAGLLAENYQRYCKNADALRFLQLNADLYVDL